MQEPRNIGIFGGTFDPVHLGHLRLATMAREALALDEVRFLPCLISPHKPGSAPTSGSDRCEMLRLATAGTDWAVLDDRELKLDGPSYSYQTAETLAVEFPGARLFWIMGSDQWDALPRWRHPERLAACVDFIVLARGENPLPRDGFRLHAVTGEHPASATEIRKAISVGTPPKWLHPAVALFITRRRLYLT